MSSSRTGTSSRLRAGPEPSLEGFTLLEVLVSVGILAIIGSLVYGAFDGMSRSRAAVQRTGDRYHQGRTALSRLTHELESAFLSLHQPLTIGQSVRTTAFIGHDEGAIDRLDFTSFSHRRLARDAHESDQNELGYFGSRDPDVPDKIDLARREAQPIDLDPTKGGIVNVVAEDIVGFELRYMDPLSGEWLDSWDSTQAAGQFNRLPLQVKIVLVLKAGVGEVPIKLETKAPLAMQAPLSFALPPGAAPSSSPTNPTSRTPPKLPPGGGMGR